MAGMAHNSQAPAGYTGDKKVDDAIVRVEALERERVQPSPGIQGDPPFQVFEQPYQEIKNLVWAKRDPVYSVALEEWQRKERLFSSRVDRREKRSADLINQIFNLVGFFSVFLGVVLTAVSQLGDCKPQCGKVWFPILLSVVAAAVTIIAILLKFTNLKELEDSINVENLSRREVVRREGNIRNLGADFRFFRHTRELKNKKAKSFGEKKICVLLALIAVTGIFVLSYLVILCDLWVIESLNRGL